MSNPWPSRPLLPAHAGVEPQGPGPSAPTPLEWAQLVLGAVRRRLLVAVGVFLLTLGAAAAYQSRKVPEYRVETKILTQAQSLPATLRNVFDESPTRSAWELVHQRENLIAIVEQARLLSNPELVRRLVATKKPKGAPNAAAAADPLEALVTVLDHALVVTSAEGTMTIQLDWPDPRQCYDIVSAALKNFLEERRVQEVVAIDDVVAVLERRAAVLRDEYDRAVEQARRRAPVAERAAAARLPARPSAEAIRVGAALEAKQRAIRDLEEFRSRRLAEVQAQLDQARTALSEAHPTVVRLRQDVQAAAQESPQLTALRAEEVELRKQYARVAPAEDLGGRAPAALPVPPRTPEEDQAVREARQNYEQIVARLNGVLVERDAARAAFKYRYNVIWPPQLPKEPQGGGWKKVLAAAVVLGVLLAAGAAVGPDLLTGRIVTRWQLERTLGIPVVGELGRK